MSWAQLQAIIAEAKAEAARAATALPVACPVDGTPLDMNSAGVLHCRFCGWKA